MVSGIVREREKREVEQGNRAAIGASDSAACGAPRPVPLSGKKAKNGPHSNGPSKWPLGYRKEELKVVHYGRDTVCVSGTIDWHIVAGGESSEGLDYPCVVDNLEECLMRVVDSNEKQLRLYLSGFGDVLFYRHRLKGKREYKYRFSYEGAMVFLKDCVLDERDPSGNFYIQYGSAACNTGDLADNHDALMVKLLCLGGNNGYTEKPSRLDMCVDVVVPCRVDMHELAKNSVPSNMQTWVVDGKKEDDGNTCYLGDYVNGKYFCRIYEKGLQVLKGENAFFRELWDIPEKDICKVVRIEYEFKRAWLREYCPAKNLRELLFFADQAFQYGLQKKRCACPGYARKRRAPVHPLWEAVRYGVWSEDGPIKISQINKSDKVKPGEDEIIVNQGLRFFDKYRKAAGMRSDVPLSLVCQSFLERIAESERLSKLFGQPLSVAPKLF